MNILASIDLIKRGPFLPFLDLALQYSFVRWTLEALGLPYARDLNLRIKNLKILFGDSRTRLVFDIGANVGNYSAAYASMGWQVISVEPDPHNVRLLKRRFKYISLVRVVPLGVASKPGVLDLHRYAQCSAHDTFSLKRVQRLQSIADPALGVSVSPSERISIELITLDQLIDNFGIPDYIKMDVEGFELDVISGLSIPVEAISFECNLPDFLDETIKCIQHLSSIFSDYQYSILPFSDKFISRHRKCYSGNELIALLISSNVGACDIIAIRPSVGSDVYANSN